MPIKASYPDERPTLVLNFHRKVFDSRITFTRASTATYFGSDGLIKTAVSGQPRFDHDPVTGECKGLLIEESRTNLLTYSESFDNAAWTKFASTVAANAVTAPDGTLTADKLVEDTSTGQHYVQEGYAATSGTWTFSVFAKAGELTQVELFVTDNVTGQMTCTFNLSTMTAGTVGASGSWTSVTAKIEALQNSWARVSISGVQGGGTSLGCRVRLYNSSSSYTGDGTSGLYIWGAQLEAGAFPTSYIPTTSTSLTRSADVASMTGTNFSSWYNQSEGTLVAEYDCNNYGTGAGNQGVLDVRRVGAASNTRTLRIYTASSGAMVAQASDDAGSAYNPNDSGGTFANSTEFKKHALAYNWSGTAQSAEAGLVTTDKSMVGSTPLVADTLCIGGLNNGATFHKNGHIKMIRYWPRRLANSELQALTT